MTYQEKTRQYEEERDAHRREKAEWRRRTVEDSGEIRQDLANMTARVTSLQEEVRKRDDLNHQLRFVVYINNSSVCCSIPTLLRFTFYKTEG